MWVHKLARMFSVNNKNNDVEQGIPESVANLQPLLATSSTNGDIGNNGNIGNNENIQRPLRPTLLIPFTLSSDPPIHPRLIELTHPAHTPSSTATSPGSTPSPPTASEFLPKRWRRSDRRLRRLNTELLEAVEAKDLEEVESLLNKGANPNATCRMDLVSACHIGALVGGGTLELLIKKGAERHRLDKLGRTPLHLAAWSGNCRQMAILLDFPEEMYDLVDKECMSSGAEEDIKKISKQTKIMANVPCDLGELKMILPKDWKDNIDHNCKDIKGSLPMIQPGWTALHVAAARVRRQCTRLLLAAGADPSQRDVRGCTPLDVAGTALYYNLEVDSAQFTEVIQVLLKAGGRHNTMKPSGLKNLNTPLHVAVELENMDAIKHLLDAGVSVACLDPLGQTPLHVCVKKQLEEPLHMLANSSTNHADPMAATVDVRDRDGHTVLQSAVEASWVTGVCVALEAGADVALKANDGETSIHSAAAIGNLDVLNEIISVAKQKSFLDLQNKSGETPLFMAVNNGHVECAQSLLQEGASIKITLPGNVNVFHKAAEKGDINMLKVLANHDENITKEMINDVTRDKKGFGPIHFAVFNNHVECVKYLLSINADVRLRSSSNPAKESTPLHVAAFKNFPEIAKVILEFDKTTILEVNTLGWYPLHTAAHHGSREVIAVLLQNGADLSGYTGGPKKFKRTAIDMIINNLTKPTEYLEELFDSYITATDRNLLDANGCVKLDYSVLMPRSCEMEQMKVIEALLKTGNRYNQQCLLVHPLLESFLYFKWKALLPFFYTILVFYAIFLGCLTIFIVSAFFYKDTNEDPPAWLEPKIWGYIVYGTVLVILCQELLYMNVKSSRYFLQLETWVKFGSLSLAMLLPPAVTITSWASAEWPRHVATIAVLLSWLEMMFLLSRFPNWGYYVLMFGKVATNVVKILATFAFLVIGFSLSFMIQFHSQIPFEGPWSALVKTIVMMTSEFDYNTLFDEQHIKDLSTSIIITRIFFVIFLILAAIVLMNLMVGVAVNDINDLEVLGNIKRLVKQVEFLATLDILVYNKFFSRVLPRRMNERVKKKRNVSNIIEIYPSRPRWRHTKMLTSRLRDAILNKATAQKKQQEDETAFQMFTEKIQEIYDRIVVDKKKRDKDREAIRQSLDVDERPHVRMKKRHDEILKHLCQVETGVSEMKDQMVGSALPTAMEEVHTKMNQMSTEIEAIKACLIRLESKLG